MKCSEDVLIAEIEAAFANTPKPATEDIVLSECASIPEWHEAALAFGKKCWNELTIEQLVWHRDALWVFTPQAYRYYLPAFLLCIVRQYRATDILPDMLVHSLIPGETEARAKDCYERVQCFTMRQRQVVIAFLQYLKVTFPEDDPFNDIDKAIDTLKAAKGDGY